MSNSSYKSSDGDHSKDLDAEQVGAIGLEKFRQRVQISGSDTPSIVEVTNTTPASDAYGLVVRLAGTGGGVGTIVDQGMPAAIGNAWPVKITDGTDTLDINSDGSIGVSFAGATTSTVIAVPIATTSTVLASANSNRKKLIIYNNSADRFLYIKLGTAGDSTDFTLRLYPRAMWEFELPMYLGEVTGVWNNTGVGTAQVTELE